jgi:hypothetical protein
MEDFGINYEERFRQPISFEGLDRHRGLRPTDIDAFIDYNGNAFVYIEAKVRYKQIETGQRLALERVVNSHEKAGHPAIAILVWHLEPPENTVILKDCPVAEIYFGGSWRAVKDGSLVDCISRFEAICKEKNIAI